MLFTLDVIVVTPVYFFAVYLLFAFALSVFIGIYPLLSAVQIFALLSASAFKSYIIYH